MPSRTQIINGTLNVTLNVILTLIFLFLVWVFISALFPNLTIGTGTNTVEKDSCLSLCADKGLKYETHTYDTCFCESTEIISKKNCAKSDGGKEFCKKISKYKEYKFPLKTYTKKEGG